MNTGGLRVRNVSRNIVETSIEGWCEVWAKAWCQARIRLMKFDSGKSGGGIVSFPGAILWGVAEYDQPYQRCFLLLIGCSS